ncbi:hypothetical protein ILYODFUR_000240 [Ilyodon furcidens]|uniref:PH domain-containing protein n=1 Tax=Ilyodon furcidens TaxID=33524 RepID=A0ABV0UC61_9TELE
MRMCAQGMDRTQAEMAHTCRGTINLATAHIDTEDACNIVLSSGGRTYHLKASTEVERQRWVTALELAKAKAIRMMNDQSEPAEDCQLSSDGRAPVLRHADGHPIRPESILDAGARPESICMNHTTQPGNTTNTASGFSK